MRHSPGVPEVARASVGEALAAGLGSLSPEIRPSTEPDRAGLVGGRWLWRDYMGFPMTQIRQPAPDARSQLKGSRVFFGALESEPRMDPIKEHEAPLKRTTHPSTTSDTMAQLAR
uniref:Uncharacterized protein n=1 Tax=Oryza barthii TaxID=65489 RepID=A0A0D3GC57_9ORYZ